MRLGWLLLFLFVWWPAIAEESKVLPMGHVNGTELGALIPKEVYGALISFAAIAMWDLIKYILKGKETKDTERDKDIKRIYELVHKIDGRVSELKAAPSEELILMRLKPYVKSEVLENLMKYKGKSPL